MTQVPIRLVLAAAVLPFLMGADQVSVFGTNGQGRAVPMTASDIEAAIEFGIAGSPEPYLLRHAWGRDDDTNDVVVGLVYTPFLRVALASRIAWSQRRQLTPRDVTPEMLAPEMHIAVRWYASPCAADGQEQPSALPVVAAGTRGLPSPSQALRNGGPPVRVWSGTSAVSDYGVLPYDDVVMVVAYPMTFLRADIDFVVAKEHAGGGCYRIGRIPADELPRWR